MIELTNGKKTITRSKIQYEANIKNFEMRGFKLVSDKVKEVKKDNDKVNAKAKNVVKIKYRISINHSNVKKINKKNIFIYKYFYFIIKHHP